MLLCLSKIHEKKLTKLKINFDDYCFGILHSGNMTLDLINSLKKKLKIKNLQFKYLFILVTQIKMIKKILVH